MIMDTEISFNTLFEVIAFILAVLLVALILKFFSETTVHLDDSGAPSALTYKLLSSPDINYQNVKQFTRKFILNPNAMSKYNNTRLPRPDLVGAYYFIEIRDPESGRMWRFSNLNDFNYAYNVRLRGVKPANEPSVSPCIKQAKSWTLSDFSGEYGNNPFQWMDTTQQQIPVTIAEGEKVSSGQAYVLVDADSSYVAGSYAVKYPLCICDLACPSSNGCQCADTCLNKEVGQGQICGVK